MPAELTQWLLAFVASSTIAIAARTRRSLSVDGMLAAITLGTLLVTSAGWWPGLLLVAFFASSSLLSHRSGGRPAIAQARGAERDAIQVLANGGVALAAAMLFGATGNASWIAPLGGAIAAANADTWSTEIGRTSPTPPRLITTAAIVPPGTSGAVSGRGLLGALGGAMAIALLAAIGIAAGWMPSGPGWLGALIAITFGGAAGAVLDSLLGATIQDQRWCDTCEKATEARTHHCGTPTRSVGGIRWIDNDVVNLCCAAVGGAIAWVLSTLMT